jgi:hypothetical protein
VGAAQPAARTAISDTQPDKSHFHSVFLAEDVFFSIFSPLNPRPFTAGVFPAVLPVKGLR